MPCHRNRNSDQVDKSNFSIKLTNSLIHSIIEIHLKTSEIFPVRKTRQKSAGAEQSLISVQQLHLFDAAHSPLVTIAAPERSIARLG